MTVVADGFALWEPNLLISCSPVGIVDGGHGHEVKKIDPGLLIKVNFQSCPANRLNHHLDRDMRRRPRRA